MQGRLAQSTQSFTLRLHGTVAQALPLFGPVREAEWAPHWSPQFLHQPGGGQAAQAARSEERRVGKECRL